MNGLEDKTVVDDEERLKLPIKLLGEVEEFQKACLGVEEEKFNAVVINMVNETCPENDLNSKEFLIGIFQLIHDNIY